MYLISFPGVSLIVSIMKPTLAISTFVPEEYTNTTQGLLGNFDGNPKNDLRAPNGTLLSSNATEREIFYIASLCKSHHWPLMPTILWRIYNNLVFIVSIYWPCKHKMLLHNLSKYTKLSPHIKFNNNNCSCLQ